jgi:hypothetical protein
LPLYILFFISYNSTYTFAISSPLNNPQVEEWEKCISIVKTAKERKERKQLYLKPLVFSQFKFNHFQENEN